MLSLYEAERALCYDCMHDPLGWTSANYDTSIDFLHRLALCEAQQLDEQSPNEVLVHHVHLISGGM